MRKNQINFVENYSSNEKNQLKYNFIYESILIPLLTLIVLSFAISQNMVIIGIICTAQFFSCGRKCTSCFCRGYYINFVTSSRPSRVLYTIVHNIQWWQLRYDVVVFEGATQPRITHDDAGTIRWYSSHSIVTKIGWNLGNISYKMMTESYQ